MTKVHAFVAALVAAATAAALVAVQTVRDVPDAHLFLLPLLVALVVQGEVLTVTLQYRQHVESLNLIETALAVVLFACSPWQLVVVVVAGMLIASVVRRNAPLKAVFNTAQWLLGASLGTIVLGAVRDASLTDGSLRNFAGLLLAVLTAVAVNQLAITTVLRLVAAERNVPDPERVPVIARAVGVAGSLSLGLTMAAAYTWSPYVVALLFVTQPLIHWASRGYAAVRADRRRLAGLQRATHALAFTLDRDRALAGFLAETASAFEARAAELVLVDLEPHEVHGCSGREHGGYTRESRPHALATELVTLREPTRLREDDVADALRAALRAEGRRETLAAPLLSGGRTIGLLFLHDRTGMEGFEDGELAVASALAAEAVGFLERAELVRTILDERRKLAEIVDNASDGIFSIDDGGTIRSWNPSVAAMTGYSAEEMVGTRHVALLRMKDVDGRDVLLERWAMQSEPPPAEVQVTSAAGEPIWLSCSYSDVPASEGDRSALVAVARNVTQAHALEKLKDDFVAVVSHELRTPLTSIKTGAQTLLSRGDRMNDAQREMALKAVMSQAQRLEQLVLNILEASRIEARGGGADSAQADVTAVVVKVVDEVVSARPDRVVRLSQPARGVVVRGSNVWLERAVANLVGNAVKYSPDDQPVDVAVDVQDGEGVVRVTDRGAGIPRDARERIFERFERLEDTSTQTGTGLGLYITRQLVRAMGGSISVDSVAGAGSTFTMRLPLAPAVELAGPAPHRHALRACPLTRTGEVVVPPPTAVTGRTLDG